MFPYSSDNRSSRLIIIKDNSITTCLAITALMVVVTWMLASLKFFEKAGGIYLDSFQPQVFRFKVKPHVIQKPSNRLSSGCSEVAQTKLEAIRTGRHPEYDSVVFQGSAEIDYEKPWIREGVIGFKLKNMRTDLCSSCMYPSIDSWVKLKEVEQDLVVRIGIPPKFLKLSNFLMKNPPRFVVNLYRRRLLTEAVPNRGPKRVPNSGTEIAAPFDSSLKRPPLAKTKISPEPVWTRLTTIRGGRHAKYASIVFQFSDTIDYGKPRIQGNEIQFRLKHITTRLRSYRKYKTFNSWVRLEKVGNGLDVSIGLLPKFIRLSSFFMEDPPRFVINLYDRGNDLEPAN